MGHGGEFSRRRRRRLDARARCLDVQRVPPRRTARCHDVVILRTIKVKLKFGRHRYISLYGAAVDERLLQQRIEYNGPGQLKIPALMIIV